MTKEELIKLAEQLCLENYQHGFDSFYECYDVAEWEEFISEYKVRNKKQLIKALNKIAGFRDDYASNIETWTECESCIKDRRFRCECEYGDGKLVQNFKPIEVTC